MVKSAERLTRLTMGVGGGVCGERERERERERIPSSSPEKSNLNLLVLYTGKS